MSQHTERIPAQALINIKKYVPFPLSLSYILSLALSLRNQDFKRKLSRWFEKKKMNGKKSKEHTRPKYDEKKKVI